MKLGIIGGLGPLASVRFYELLTIMSDVDKDQEHLEIMLYSYPQIPDRTAYILNHHANNPLPYLMKAIKELEDTHVDLIAIPCITAHYFYDELSCYSRVPLIHLINEVILFLKRQSIGKVGIMATDGTLQSQLFQKTLTENHIQYYLPDDKNQRKVMNMIYQGVKSGKTNDYSDFIDVSHHLSEQGAEYIILGCTELSIIYKDYPNQLHYLDVLTLLSVVALQKGGIPIKQDYLYLLR